MSLFIIYSLEEESPDDEEGGDKVPDEKSAEKGSTLFSIYVNEFGDRMVEI